MLAFHASDSGSNPDISTPFSCVSQIIKQQMTLPFCFVLRLTKYQKRLLFRKSCGKPVAAGNPFQNHTLAECLDGNTCRGVKIL